MIAQITRMAVDKKAYNNAIQNLKECSIREKKVNSHPLKIYIEPTTACNLDCMYCIPLNQRKVEEMSMEMFYAIRDQLFDHCSEVNLFLEGEPTLSRNFPEILDICAKYPFITKFFSNLSYKNDDILIKMVESGVYLNVSFDGVEFTTLARKGTNIELVERNIKFLMEQKEKIKNDKFHMRMASVINKYSADRIPDIIDWAHDMGFSEIMLGCLDTDFYSKKYAVTGKELCYFDQAAKLCDDIKMRFSIPSHIGGKPVKKSNNWNDFKLPVDKYFPHFVEDCNPDVNRRFCPYPWIQAVFRANGEVVSCCQRKIKMAKFTPDTDFIKEIWNNEAYQKIRSVGNYRKCRSPIFGKCNMIRYSIWGGECRLNNIPDILD